MREGKKMNKFKQAREAFSGSPDQYAWFEEYWSEILEALAIAERMQWQPIETAPKDGTKCLFLTPIPEIGSPAYYMNDGRVFTGRFTNIGNFDLEGCYTRNPIAWMPLPETKGLEDE